MIVSLVIVKWFSCDRWCTYNRCKCQLQDSMEWLSNSEKWEFLRNKSQIAQSCISVWKCFRFKNPVRIIPLSKNQFQTSNTLWCMAAAVNQSKVFPFSQFGDTWRWFENSKHFQKLFVGTYFCFQWIVLIRSIHVAIHITCLIKYYSLELNLYLIQPFSLGDNRGEGKIK